MTIIELRRPNPEARLLPNKALQLTALRCFQFQRLWHHGASRLVWQQAAKAAAAERPFRQAAAIEGDVNIEVHHEAQPEDDSFVRSELDRFNHAAGPFGAIQPLRCFARDRSGLLVGAAIGHTWGTSCELGQLWVTEPKRRQGLGSQLLRRFESEARLRGSVLIYLDTFSFHAPQFYQAHGYEVASQFGGLPDAAVLYILHKSLAAA